MKILNVGIGLLALSLAPLAYADLDLSKLNVKTVKMEMGTRDGRMYFEPDNLVFHTGQAYKLVLKNVDQIKHELDAGEFRNKVFTRKVEVIGPDDKMIAEIKGSIHEIELAPGGEAEWFFVPVQTGTNMEMECALEGHKAAGMHGLITIK